MAKEGSSKKYRSSLTGKWISKAYASKHPKTTVSEKVGRKGKNTGGTIGGGAKKR